jgi:hypothetical protein
MSHRTSGAILARSHSGPHTKEAIRWLEWLLHNLSIRSVLGSSPRESVLSVAVGTTAADVGMQIQIYNTCIGYYPITLPALILVYYTNCWRETDQASRVCYPSRRPKRDPVLWSSSVFVLASVDMRKCEGFCEFLVCGSIQEPQESRLVAGFFG